MSAGEDEFRSGDDEHDRQDQRNRARRKPATAEMRTERAADHRWPCKNQTEERQGAVHGEITNQPSDRIDEDEDRRNGRRLTDSGPLKKKQRRGEKYSATSPRQAREDPDDSTQASPSRWAGQLD